MKIGLGFDSHALVKGRPLILGGVKIPYSLGLAGYSDADVLVHAIADALLGAAGFSDIGNLFPAGDKRYKSVSSLKLLSQVQKKLKKFSLVNLDAVIICDQPALNKFLPKMRQNIAAALDAKISQITLKAKHAEGFESLKNKFMAVYAVCLLK